MHPFEITILNIYFIYLLNRSSELDPKSIKGGIQNNQEHGQVKYPHLLCYSLHIKLYHIYFFFFFFTKLHEKIVLPSAIELMKKHKLTPEDIT